MSTKSTYAWIVTRSHWEAEDMDEVGPRNASAALVQALRAGKGRAFRMYDDDGELYYSGRAITSDGEYDWDNEMGNPLYDYGAPAAGATRYVERIGSKWEDIIG